MRQRHDPRQLSANSDYRLGLQSECVLGDHLPALRCPGFLVPEFGTHALLQFFPRFSWSDAGIHHGLIESLAYGWYVALVFGALFNFFARRGGSGEARDRSKPAMSNV